MWIQTHTYSSEELKSQAHIGVEANGALNQI